MACWQKSYPVLQHFEGIGKVTADKADHGGLTKGGISLTFLKACGSMAVARGGGDVNGDGRVDAADVLALTPDTIEDLMRDHFWAPWQLDGFDQTVATKLLLGTVHCGQPQACRLLQQALGVAIDGAFGPKTRAAATAADPAELTRRLAQVFEAYYYRLAARDPSQAKYVVAHDGGPGGWILRARWGLPYRAESEDDHVGQAENLQAAAGHGPDGGAGAVSGAAVAGGE